MSELPTSITAGTSIAAKQIEDFPAGYPRLTALIASDSAYHVSRRFLGLRARLLLHKQDNLAVLEEDLNRIDREETRLLFLGNYRRENNEERKQIMSRIDHELTDYDALVKRNKEIIDMGYPNPRAISNLQNWLANTGCIYREETKFLELSEDLMTLGDRNMDSTIKSIQFPIGCMITALVERYKGLERLRLRSNASRDPYVFIWQDGWIELIGRFVLIWFLGLTITIPVIAVEHIRNLTSRLIAAFLGTTLFIALLSFTTRAKTVELFMAGATYAAVLTAFINNEAKQSPASVPAQC